MLYKSFQFCYCNVNAIVARKHVFVPTNAANNIKVLMESFGFTGQQVISLMDRQKSLSTKETAELKESYEFCKKIGISNDDLCLYPSLLSSHPLMKINHYNSLRDTGCEPIDAALLSSASTYFRRKIIFLKRGGYLKANDNVADRLLGCLDQPIEKPKILRQELKILDQMCWTAVHKAILVDWLKRRLNATSDDLIKLFRIHKMIKNKSFRTINENITLAESLGLSSEKILKCGYLLNNYPEYPKTMLRDHPSFAGLDMARVYKNNPKMMMVNPRRIMEIYDILKEYNISDELIQRKPDVFSLNPLTLRYRLEQIRKVPEFRVLLEDPRMLKLVVHHNKIRSRLSFLKSLKLRCASLSFIGTLDGAAFENYIQEGKDINRPVGVVGFVCRLLDKKPEDVQHKLQRHPYYCYVPFVDIDSTFKYVIAIGYTKENIARCPLILLYPNEKITLAIHRLNQDRDLNFRQLSQYKQLSLILYHIEKEHHFTGNGIWRMKLKRPEIDEKTLE